MNKVPYKPNFHVALYEPEIPQNTGNIGRICLGFHLHLHLIHPLGFKTTEKALRRAGLDYWSQIQCTEHHNSERFWKYVKETNLSPILFTTKTKRSYTQCAFTEKSILVFGPESRGLPVELFAHNEVATIPMFGNIRSFNLANSVAMACAQGMQQIHPQFYQN